MTPFIHTIADCLGYTALVLLFVFTCIGIDLALTWAIRRWRK